MEQNFSLMAQSRANYYTAGSPVQFVRVELLKGDVTGEVAVCLTFKNVGTEPVTGLVIHFKCKDAAGQVLCEDDFYYEQLNAMPGDLFGADDAVYVSDTPVSSVEIEQDRAFLNGRGVDLRGYKRVRLQMPRVLPGSIAKTLQTRMGNAALTCVPQDIEQGWFCACGAFHPNEENTTLCSECGAERTQVKVQLTSILEEARRIAETQQREIGAVVEPAAATAAAAQAAINQQAEQPQQATTQYDPSAARGAAMDAEEERVRRYAPKGRLFDDDDDETDGTRMYDTEETDSYNAYEEDTESGSGRGRYVDEDEESEDDVMAERIIRWAPPITAVICALIIAVSLIYNFLIA